jgi:hypothetical protein
MNVDFTPDTQDYDAAWALHNLCFTQHRGWGEVKRPAYEPRFLLADEVAIAVHQRRLPGLGGYYGYAPRALNNSLMQPADWLQLAADAICKELNLTHLIVEPNAELTSREQLEPFVKVGFAVEEDTIQPRYSRLIDLSRSEDELFGDMSRDVRRRIQRSDTAGYRFEEKTDTAGLDEFYGGLSAVASRGRFAIQPKAYFARMLDAFAGTVMPHIYFCRDAKGTLLYGLFSIYDNGVFRRIWGGPTRGGRAGDAAQFTAWASIKAAKALSAHTLDLWGVAPYDDNGYKRGHSLSGVSAFKASLGGRNVTYYPQLIWVRQRQHYRAYKLFSRTHRRLSGLRRLLG